MSESTPEAPQTRYEIVFEASGTVGAGTAPTDDAEASQPQESS